MEKSEQINELALALSKAQGSMKAAARDSENPFFKSRYADLASVCEVARRPLADNGLAVTQHPAADGNIVTVETALCHASGQWLSSRLTMLAKDASPQAIGSCITYLRRYSLSSVLGIASEEDDDGNSAQPAKGQQATAKPAQPKPQAQKSEVATVVSRSKMIHELDAADGGLNRKDFTEYLQALGWLPKDKEPENLALCYVPTTQGEFKAMHVALHLFAIEGKAEAPYPPHGIDATKLPTPTPKTPPTPVSAPSGPVWASFVMPIGKPASKGKRMGELPKEELEWYFQNFSPQIEVTLPDETIVPLSEQQVKSQRDLRAMLDLAGRDLGFTQPKEAE